MSLSVSIQIVVDGIFAASERRDWSAIQRLGERVRMIILDAAADRNRSGLSEVAKALEIAEAVFPDAGDDVRLARVGWMLKMDAGLAKLAARRIPAQNTSASYEDSSARDRILQALAGANTAPSVASIAKMTGLARETVSRLLPAMAGEGLVRFKKVGRKTLSRITQKGRATMGDGPVDIATSIRNFHGLHMDFVMTSSSLAQKRAHMMVGAHAKRQPPIKSDEGHDWFDAYADAQESVLGLRNNSLPLPRVEALQMITKDGTHNVRDRIMEISA